MPPLLRAHGKRRVVILGAGFNAPLGMPLTADLLSQVHAVAAGKPWRRLDVQIIGSSIRPGDYHSRALLDPPLVRGARGGRLRVAVVERAPDARTREEIIVRFTDVQGCRFWFDGYSPHALDFLDER